MSGYLYRSKGSKKPWKHLWFVIKNKVLYTYAASEVRWTLKRDFWGFVLVLWSLLEGFALCGAEVGLGMPSKYCFRQRKVLVLFFFKAVLTE